MEVALLWVRPVTAAPMFALISTLPELVPELVMVPVLLIDVVDRVIPAAVALLLLRIRLPAPVTPPETVNSLVPRVLVRVVPPLLTVRAVVLIVRAEVVEFWLMLVTLDPTPPLMVTPPVLVPETVTVPALLRAYPEIVMPLALLELSLRITLPVPRTPPLSVRTPEPAVWIVEFAPSVIAVLMVLAALSPLATKIPAPLVLPRLMPVPPLSVIATLSSRVMLLAA